MERHSSIRRGVPALLAVVIFSGVAAYGALGDDQAPVLKPRFSVSDKPLLTAADAQDVPTWELRARVISSEGKEPPEAKKFAFYFDPEHPGFVPPARGPKASGLVTATGDAWTDWLSFDQKMGEACVFSRIGKLTKRYPVLVYFVPWGVVTPARIEIEIRLNEGAPVQAYTTDLFSPGVPGGAAGETGIHTWRDTEGQPHVALRGEFNQGYWDFYKTIAIPEAQRPKLFLLGAPAGYHHDSDRFNGTPYLAGIGINVEQFTPPPEKRDLLLHGGGLHRVTNLLHAPIFEFTGKATAVPGSDKGQVKPGNTTVADLEQWAHGCLDSFRNAGFQPQDIGMVGIADAPMWSYPGILKTLAENPAALKSFHDYLQAQGLSPADVGATSWEQVRPLGRSQAANLPARRLFYWTVRFCSWDSARHFAGITRALEKDARPDLPVFVDLRTDRLYSPGARRPDTQAAASDRQDAASAGADAASGGPDWLEFGRMRGVSMLWSQVSDAQAAETSLRIALLRCAAAKGGVPFGGYVSGGSRPGGTLQTILSVVGSGGKGLFYWIGPTEHFTYNAYRENPRVLAEIATAHRMIGQAEALLWPGVRPRAQVAILAPRSAELWEGVNGAAGNCMAEEAHLYQVLRQADVPIDFVEEDDLSAQGLAPYKVLFVTEPNIPAESQKGLVAWVEGRGTLVMSKGAGARDRYNDPCNTLTEGLANVGSARVVRFSWTPGTFSEAVRDQTISPVRAAKIVPPVTVDRAMIETPLLLSPKGGAVTLLNWTGQPQKEVKITVRLPFAVKSVESVTRGKLAFSQTQEGVPCALPLDAGDIVLLRP